MATLYVSEYTALPFLDARPTNISKEPPITDQTITISGSSTQSNAFSGSTYFVRLHTDSICSVAFGANPTATVVTKRLAANQTEYFAVNPGHKVAVITNT